MKRLSIDSFILLLLSMSSLAGGVAVKIRSRVRISPSAFNISSFLAIKGELLINQDTQEPTKRLPFRNTCNYRNRYYHYYCHYRYHHYSYRRGRDHYGHCRHSHSRYRRLPLPACTVTPIYRLLFTPEHLPPFTVTASILTITVTVTAITCESTDLLRTVRLPNIPRPLIKNKPYFTELPGGRVARASSQYKGCSC